MEAPSLIIEKFRALGNLESQGGSVFEQTPVSLDEFLYGSSFLNIKKFSPTQYEFIKHGTLLYKDAEIESLGWDKPRRVGELVALWGKGAGKDFVSQITFCRVVYMLLCLKSPQYYYDLAETSSIDTLNMAYSSDQANSVFFKTFSDMVMSCPFLRKRANVCKTMIQFEKKITAYSGNSFEEAFEGKNLILCVLDEVSAFKTKQEVAQLAIRRLRAPRYSAESVYDMAKSSVESRFSGYGKVISISFPRFKNDYIQQLYAAGKEDSNTYVSFGTTWDVNPYKKRSDFDAEFKKNPERAQARYAADPSAIEGGYYKDKVLLAEAFPIIEKDLVPTVDDYVPYLKPWFKCKHSFLCSVHIDLGLKCDKCGIAMSHISGFVEKFTKNELGEKTTVNVPVVEMDLITSFIVPQNGEIRISDVRDYIVELVNRGFKIGKLTMDSFQSFGSLQDFNRMGIESELRSVDRNTSAWDCLKDLIYDKRLKGYSHIRSVVTSTKTLLMNEIIDELSNLIMVTGTHLDHPAYGSKDVADAVAGSVQGALEIGFSGFSKEDIMVGQDRLSVLNSEAVNDREFLSTPTGEYFSSTF